MKQLWNDGWYFVKLPSHSTLEQMDAAVMTPVVLPHDWLISQSQDLYESSDGWYRKEFEVREELAEKSWIFSFDGIYMDAEIYLDRELLKIHRNGYTSFHIQPDLWKPHETSDAGTRPDVSGKHEILVHVRYQSPNTRWYSGAGIYRDVRLSVLPETHFIPDGFRVDPWREEGYWNLSVSAEITAPYGSCPVVKAKLLDEEGNAAAEIEMKTVRESDTADSPVLTAAGIISLGEVRAWSLDDPYLYSLILELEGEEECIPVGFRQVDLSADKGLFLNGKHVKLHGVCLHHDLGLLGAAFHEKAALRQLLWMKRMGVNAVRTSHNPPARQFLDLCDRLGILVIDEFTDMWEISKTEYDYARFFRDSYKEDVADWIRRDRCHPSVVFWSIGNEIPDMHVSAQGVYWTKTLAEEVRLHDDRHAAVTFGSNYMPWEGAQKCAEVIGIPGYNYAERLYDKHHKEHPDWIIYGSETASVVFSRGIYHFPIEQEILSEEDLQCSALMNSNTSWGAQDLPKMLSDDLNTPYSLGQFIWSGIDYIGEPTPYHTRNSYFGQMDTACFPKDSYYFYQAMWTEKPMIHIGVYWDWNEGQLIDVPVMTNADAAELFLNGMSMGIKKVDRSDAGKALPVWKIPYEKGILRAAAYDEEGRVLVEETISSFGEPVSIVLSYEIPQIKASDLSQGDLIFVTASVKDAMGRTVENASDRIHFSVEGPVVLLGLDNGDSADKDGYKVESKRLFSGKLLAAVAVKGEAAENETIKIIASGSRLESAELIIPVTLSLRDRPVPTCGWEREQPSEELCLARRIELKALGSTNLTPNHPAVSFAARFLPDTAMDQKITFRVVNAHGVDVPWANAEITGKVQWNGKDAVCVQVNCSGDGDFYLRASACNGYVHPRILSHLELHAEGFGRKGPDPYCFTAASLYNEKEGTITSGNEKGISFSREEFSAVGFTGVDFGPVGADAVTLPVFCLDDDPCLIQLWDGAPSKGGVLLQVLHYQKKSIWNVYQEEVFLLDEPLQGIHDIWFAMERKIHLKGFTFRRRANAFGYHAAPDADRIYGDSFRLEKEAVYEIGNNVSIVFETLCFGDREKCVLALDGSTPLPMQPVNVYLRSEGAEESRTMCWFEHRKERGKQFFELDIPKGICSLSFVFLPGSRFDFYGFEIMEAKNNEEF